MKVWNRVQIEVWIVPFPGLINFRILVLPSILLFELLINFRILVLPSILMFELFVLLS